MLDREKDWMSVKYGYFILVSNMDTTPGELLNRYFERTEIENFLKHRRNTSMCCHCPNGTIRQSAGKF